MTIETVVYEHVTWTNVEQPTEADMRILHERYPHFHPLDLEDCLSRIERPKIDEYDEYLFIVMHFPIFDRRQRISRPAEVDFFIGHGYLVTVHDGILQPIAGFFDLCQQDEAVREQYFTSSGRLLHAVIDRLVDYLFPILNKVEANIREIEEDIFTEDMRRIVQGISFVRRDIIALRRIVRPQPAIVANLERVDRPYIREELDVYFGDILDHLNKARDIIDDDYEVVEGLSATSDTLTSYRTNDVMKMLAIITITFSFLEAMTGLYGMNLAWLPLASRPYAFFVLVGLMLLGIGGILIYFRHRRWL
nr:magnesium transporter [Anaerolineae bacterium]